MSRCVCGHGLSYHSERDFVLVCGQCGECVFYRAADAVRNLDGAS